MEKHKYQARIYCLDKPFKEATADFLAEYQGDIKEKLFDGSHLVEIVSNKSSTETRTNIEERFPNIEVITLKRLKHDSDTTQMATTTDILNIRERVQAGE